MRQNRWEAIFHCPPNFVTLVMTNEETKRVWAMDCESHRQVCGQCLKIGVEQIIWRLLIRRFFENSENFGEIR
jgi:hypothetical protein